MSADTSRDRLQLTADDTTITAEGSDATRITFRATDAYGNHRPNMTGQVTLTLTGPATLIGQNPFAFASYGGVGGAFIRSIPTKNRPGNGHRAACHAGQRVRASHRRHGSSRANISDGLSATLCIQPISTVAPGAEPSAARFCRRDQAGSVGQRDRFAGQRDSPHPVPRPGLHQDRPSRERSP